MDGQRRTRRAAARIINASGGVAAQGSQSLASFVLQVVVARLLGVEGLGRFAALYALVVLATAITSGFVGDSLTVLDRSRPDIRAGLQAWLVTVALLVAFTFGLGARLTGFVTTATAVAFMVATWLFLLEDTVRRMLMATLVFWRIVVVDLTALGAALATIAMLAVTGDGITLFHVLAGLAVGQGCALLVGVALLPRAERYLAPARPASMAAVAAYGAWRALQQAVRPAMLAVLRMVCLLAVSLAAVGEMEAARIYVAPTMIVVGGVASVLFATYAVDRSAPLLAAIRRTDRNVLALVAVVAGIGVAAVVALPWLGPILTGGEYDLAVPTVVGWVGYAAATAASTPYGQLAAVRGRHVAVLAVRVTESVVSLLAVTAAVLLDRSVVWVPLVLTVVALLAGGVLRLFVLRAMAISAPVKTGSDATR